MYRVCGVVVFAVLVVFLVPTGRAQVSVEKLTVKPLKDGFSGFVQADLALARGNVEYVNVGGAVYGMWQSLHEPRADADEDEPAWMYQRVFLTANGRFAENAKGTYISSAYAHARWTAMWHPRVGSELFAQFQYNDFIRLARRALGGAGIRFDLLHLKEVMLYGGTAVMAEYEKVEVREGADDTPEVTVARWTNYLTLRLALFDGQLLLQNTVYVQPRLDRFEDIRVLNILDVVVKVSPHLAFGTALSFLHDSEPPTGVKSDDLALRTSIRVSF